MARSLEVYIRDCIKGEEKGFKAFFLRPILRLLSWFYRFGAAIRNWCFDKGFLSLYCPPVPVVISVGNIVAGGTGKTPVTLALAQAFADEFSVAILSRGYRSQVEKLKIPVILSRGQGPLHNPSYCGDEPFLLAQNVSKAFVIVGSDRKTASVIAAKAGVQLIILDDGMQHRRLARDYEVVVMDAHDPFGKGFFLPRGFLRESCSSLNRADLIIFNHIIDQEHIQKLKSQIAPYTKAPVVGVRLSTENVYDLKGNLIENLQNQKVGLFCGIANPEYFKETLKETGAEIVEQYCIADHGSFDLKKLQVFAAKAKAQGAKWIVCTEKDKVRLKENSVSHLPIAWLKMRLDVISGKAAWDEFLNQAKEDLLRSV